MRAIYAEQLETPDAELAIEQALATASEANAELLCYERDAAGCHRSMLADRMAQRAAFQVHDI